MQNRARNEIRTRPRIASGDVHLAGLSQHLGPYGHRHIVVRGRYPGPNPALPAGQSIILPAKHEQAEDRNSNTSDSDVEDGLSACFVFGRQNNRKAASYPLSSTPIAQGVSTCADSRKSIGMCQTQVIICKMDGGGGGGDWDFLPVLC